MTAFARLYGGSLYQLAAEEQKDDALLEELDAVLALFGENPDYYRLLDEPSLPKAERTALLDEALGGGADPYLLNFLKILVEHGSIEEFKGCAGEYRRLYNQAHGILPVTACSAVPLSENQAARLKDKLEQLTGKTVCLSRKVEPALLGGIRLQMEGTQLDGTVQHRLARLKTDLANIVL